MWNVKHTLYCAVTMPECCTLDVVSVKSSTSTLWGCTCGGVMNFPPYLSHFWTYGSFHFTSGECVGFVACVFPLTAVSAVRACALLAGGWYFYDFHWEQHQSRVIERAFSFPLLCRSFINRASLPAESCLPGWDAAVGAKKVVADSGLRWAKICIFLLSSYLLQLQWSDATCCAVFHSLPEYQPPHRQPVRRLPFKVWGGCHQEHLLSTWKKGHSVPVTRNSKFSSNQSVEELLLPILSSGLRSLSVLFGLSSKHQKVFRKLRPGWSFLENSASLFACRQELFCFFFWLLIGQRER